MLACIKMISLYVRMMKASSIKENYNPLTAKGVFQWGKTFYEGQLGGHAI